MVGIPTPIINHPEVAIVGVNKIATRPVWDGRAFIPRKMMNLSSSFDHRVIDGWEAAVFVQRIKALLETPALIFMGRERHEGHDSQALGDRLVAAATSAPSGRASLGSIPSSSRRKSRAGRAST